MTARIPAVVERIVKSDDFASPSISSLPAWVFGQNNKDHSHTVLEARVAKLEAANNAASKRKKRKRKQIQVGGTLSQVEAEEIVRQRDAEAEEEAERVEAGGNNKGVRRCKTCGEAGHNKRTCKENAAGAEDQF